MQVDEHDNDQSKASFVVGVGGVVVWRLEIDSLIRSTCSLPPLLWFLPLPPSCFESQRHVLLLLRSVPLLVLIQYQVTGSLPLLVPLHTSSTVPLPHPLQASASTPDACSSSSRWYPWGMSASQHRLLPNYRILDEKFRWSWASREFSCVNEGLSFWCEWTNRVEDQSVIDIVVEEEGWLQ